MVGPLGHYGVALLGASVVVYRLRRKDGLLFSLFVLLAAMLPDQDTSLPWVAHRGATHTIAFGVGVAVFGGLLLTVSFAAYQRATGRDSDEPTARRVATLAATGLFTGVLSHLVADALTILPPGLPGARPIRPFWPVVSWPVNFGLLPPFWNVSNLLLLLAGGVAWVLAFATADSIRGPDEQPETSD